MIELKMVAAGVGVAEVPGKRLILVDPDSNIRVYIDLEAQAVSELAAGLLGGVQVASALPPWEKPV